MAEEQTGLTRKRERSTGSTSDETAASQVQKKSCTRATRPDDYVCDFLIILIKIMCGIVEENFMCACAQKLGLQTSYLILLRVIAIYKFVRVYISVKLYHINSI